MQFPTRCPVCSAQFMAQPHLLGQQVPCPTCQRPFIVQNVQVSSAPLLTPPTPIHPIIPTHAPIQTPFATAVAVPSQPGGSSWVKPKGSSGGGAAKLALWGVGIVVALIACFVTYRVVSFGMTYVSGKVARSNHSDPGSNVEVQFPGTPRIMPPTSNFSVAQRMLEANQAQYEKDGQTFTYSFFVVPPTSPEYGNSKGIMERCVTEFVSSFPIPDVQTAATRVGLFPAIEAVVARSGGLRVPGMPPPANSTAGRIRVVHFDVDRYCAISWRGSWEKKDSPEVERFFNSIKPLKDFRVAEPKTRSDVASSNSTTSPTTKSEPPVPPVQYAALGQLTFDQKQQIVGDYLELSGDTALTGVGQTINKHNVALLNNLTDESFDELLAEARRGGWGLALRNERDTKRKKEIYSLVAGHRNAVDKLPDSSGRGGGVKQDAIHRFEDFVRTEYQLTAEQLKTILEQGKREGWPAESVSIDSSSSSNPSLFPSGNFDSNRKRSFEEIPLEERQAIAIASMAIDLFADSIRESQRQIFLDTYNITVETLDKIRAESKSLLGNKPVGPGEENSKWKGLLTKESWRQSIYRSHRFFEKIEKDRSEFNLKTGSNFGRLDDPPRERTKRQYQITDEQLDDILDEAIEKGWDKTSVP